MHPVVIEGPVAGRALGAGKQLSAADDVEEELFIHGSADLFSYDARWNRAAARGRAVR